MSEKKWINIKGDPYLYRYKDKNIIEWKKRSSGKIGTINISKIPLNHEVLMHAPKELEKKEGKIESLYQLLLGGIEKWYKFLGVPLSHRTYMLNILGSKNPITEKNLTERELLALNILVLNRQKKRGEKKNIVRYQDYGDYQKAFFKRAEEAERFDTKQKFSTIFNPGLYESLQKTFGMATVEGDSLFVDKYDFYSGKAEAKERDRRFEERGFFAPFKEEGRTMYSIIRDYTHLLSNFLPQRDVRIRL